MGAQISREMTGFASLLPPLTEVILNATLPPRHCQSALPPTDDCLRSLPPNCASKRRFLVPGLFCGISVPTA